MKEQGVFWTLICAQKGEAQYPIHLLYLSAAPQLNYFLFAVKSMEILDCLVLLVFSFPLDQKVLSCGMPIQLWPDNWKNSMPCSWNARTARTIHAPQPFFS